MQDLCILPIIVLEPSLPSGFCFNFFIVLDSNLASAFFYCSEAKPGLRILSPGFSEQSAIHSFSTPFIRSEFLSFFLSEICSKTDADLNRKVFLKSSLQCNAMERRFQKMHFPISFLDSSPIPWSPHLCGRIPWDGNGSLIFLFCAHFDLQEFVYICKNLFIFVRICLDLQEFVYICKNLFRFARICLDLHEVGCIYNKKSFSARVIG